MKKSHAIPRWWDWTAIILLFLLLETLASRLVSTSWTPFLYLIQLFVSQGIVIGLILGYSQFKPGTARWLSLFYMLLLLPLQWTLVIDQRVSLEEQLASVWGRLYFSVSELIAQRPVDDPIFFVTVMSIAFWIVSSSAGFSLTRYQNYLRAVIPSAIGILVIQHYDNVVTERIWWLGFFTFIALLLLGRMYFLQNRVSWISRRVFVSTENSLDLAGGMAFLAVGIIVLAFLVPASRPGFESAIKTWNRLTKPWHELTEKLENAVSAVDAPSGGVPGEFFGTELQLGRGFPLSEAVMFKVEAPSLTSEEKPPRYYWRGRVYDYFSAGQWYITGAEAEEYSPLEGGPSLPNTEERDPRPFNFEVGDSRFGLLYAPSQTVWFSRPGSFLASPAGTEKDIYSWKASPSLLPGETYQVQAVLSNPNIEQLREAGTNYPQWVTEKYLQLPSTFPPRIAELAQTVTASESNPYDKAVAVTRYLREEIEYAETIPAPPRNHDVLEWVLFEHKKGFCVYYASSEVLMLRSLGIPARMAVGFAEGSPTTAQFSNEDVVTTFTVLKKDAHAWPEVYFPGIGWVEFEPTGNQSILNRPLPPVESDLENNSNPATDLRTEDSTNFADRNLVDDPGITPEETQETTVSPSLYLVPVFIVLATLSVFLGRRYNLPVRIPVFLHASLERTGTRVPLWVIRWENWAQLSAIERAFESINFGLRLLKQPPPIHSTPVERATTLLDILPTIAEPVKILLDEHQTSLYTFRIADVNRAKRSAIQIRLQTIIARVRHFLTGEYAIHS